MSSGDEIQAGRVTGAESTTFLVGQKPSELDVDFNGTVVFVVGPGPGAQQPEHTTHGILGIGWNGNLALNPLSLGGTGVIGKGGPNQGTGVQGQGGASGGGGLGVHGIGGSRLQIEFRPMDPGIGVLGQGGQHPNLVNAQHLPHASGVVGIAGGAGGPIPAVTTTGGAGVFGQGSNAELPDGPSNSGPGVMGLGGLEIHGNGHIGAGVVGVAGGHALPAPSATEGAGVFGVGPKGVVGKGDMGGRGGVFSANLSPQLRLVPMDLDAPLPPQVTVTPTIYNTNELPIHLPKAGQNGDLLVTSSKTLDGQVMSTLWFCVQGVTGVGPARWGQVLLGPLVDGSI